MRIYIVIIILLAAMFSCESPANIELKDGQQTLSLTSFIYNNNNVTVNIYGSVSYTDSSRYSQIDEAVFVALQQNSILQEILELDKGSTSLTFYNTSISAGDSIKISAFLENKEITATTVILSPTEIISLDTTTIIAEGTLDFLLTFSDISATTDYYQLEIRRTEKTPDGEKLSTIINCNYDDYLFYLASSNLLGSNALNNSGLFNDEKINGQTYALSFSVDWDEIINDTAEESGIELEIRLYRHTYDYYHYKTSSLRAADYVMLPVFGIPTIHSNVSGGVGIVSGMSFDKTTIEINRE